MDERLSTPAAVGEAVESPRPSTRDVAAEFLKRYFEPLDFNGDEPCTVALAELLTQQADEATALLALRTQALEQAQVQLGFQRQRSKDGWRTVTELEATLLVRTRELTEMRKRAEDWQATAVERMTENNALKASLLARTQERDEARRWNLEARTELMNANQRIALLVQRGAQLSAQFRAEAEDARARGYLETWHALDTCATALDLAFASPGVQP